MAKEMRLALVTVLICAVCAPSAIVTAESAPFSLRRVRGQRPNLIDRQRTVPADWPEEPPSPPVLDIERFAQALLGVCVQLRPEHALPMATWVVRQASRHEVDPFLIAGVVVERSRGTCRTPSEGLEGAVGLTQIMPDLYRDAVRQGSYSYQVLEPGGGWSTRSLDLGFEGGFFRALKNAHTHLGVTAGLLRAWHEQCGSLDSAFDQQQHRHFVSHFVWGDRVRSHRQEDRILTARRRALELYGTRVAPTLMLGDVPFRAPLEGAPRVVTSGLGAARDGGQRRHRGVDLDSLPGESVRAVAGGTVTFAGADLPGALARRQLRVAEYAQLSAEPLGSGGLFVCMRHRLAEARVLRSCYMHLRTVLVEAGTEIAAGARIGTVGRTGMERSAAHLHFELHDEDGPMNPQRELTPLLLGPMHDHPSSQRTL